MRWPLFLILIVVSSVGLWIGRKIDKGLAPDEAAPLADAIFRIPLALTLVYGLLQWFRTLWYWVESSEPLVLLDPPGNDAVAALANGLLLSWLSIYVLFLYLRRRQAKRPVP